MSLCARLALLLFVITGSVLPAAAQESAYFVTYDHYLEEPGNLEIALVTTTGLPKHGRHAYTAPWLEVEFGVTGWWTTEFYLEGVATRGDGRAFTGWRLENRFRPFETERRVNPVIYVEYENINEASRIQKEIVGSGGVPFEPIDELRMKYAHELEGKLILSSTVRGWNLSENVIVEKNLSESEGFEFGYAVGASRPLGGLARGTSCRRCAENFNVGAEVYGGLGSSQSFDRAGQRHYLAPVVGWRLGARTSLKASVGFGLTETAERYLIRFGLGYELPVGRR